MNDSARHRLNAGTAAGKVIEGEAIVINVVTGRYYSLEDAGCVAWAHLAAGAPLGDTVAAVTARYDVSAERAHADVASLAERLVSEELLVAVAEEAHAQPVDEAELPGAGSLRPYTTPELFTFTDMEELLAFDPPLPVAAPQDLRWGVE